MAGANITIEVDEAPVLEALQRLQRRADDLEPAFRDIGEYLMEATKTRIEQGGPAPDGTPWAPLSEVTKARKTQNKDKVLNYHGHLLNSIHYQAGSDEVAVGTNRVYAAAQQFGMKKGDAGRGHYKTRKGSFPIPWGDIPARPFLGLSDADEREVLAILEEHLQLTV